MSLIYVKYELDERDRIVVNAKISPDVLSFVMNNVGQNNETSADVNLSITAQMSARRTGYGVHARGVMIAWSSGPPAGYSPNGLIFIPILRLFRYQSVKVGGTGTFKGQPVTIVSKRPETLGG